VPKTINNADAAQALVRAYALKGRVNLQLDEMVVPVSIVDNLAAEGTPIELRPCGANVNRTAVAAEFAYVGVQTQDGLALSVGHFDVLNTGAGVGLVRIVLLSAANLTTIGITAGAMVAKDLPKDSNSVGSQFFTATDATSIGVFLGIYALTPTSTTRIPIGVTIYGRDNPNRVAVALVNNSQNSAVQMVASCVERDDVPGG